MSAAFDQASARGAHPAPACASLRVHYAADMPAAHWLSRPETLAVIAFGPAGTGPEESAQRAATPGDPRLLQTGLRALQQPAPLEVWSAAGPVRTGVDGILRHAGDGQLQFLSLALADSGDIRDVARDAYAQIRRFTATSGYPHVLRMWNYFDAITEGEGDAERYRQFCIGRADGMGEHWGPLPAATAVGRAPEDACGSLQVYALAARAPGLPLENPRQVSAYRYPRQYGPQPPSFARAMLPSGDGVPLLLSGTASVVGHASTHAGSLPAQVVETCVNLEHLLETARGRLPTLPARFGAGSALKVYVRDPSSADAVRALLQQRYPDAGLLLLQAEVCRDELLVEIDGFHAG